MLFIGIDLAWAAPAERDANDTGVVSLDETGRVLAAGWTVGFGRQMLSDLRESGSLEQDASMVLFLHLPEARTHL